MRNDLSFNGYPIGKVAKSIRKELHPELTDHEVEAITIVLLYHLIIENKVNKLLYKCSGDIDSSLLNEKLLEGIKWEMIEEMSFSKKMMLIKLLAKKLWRKDHTSILNDFKLINKIRNDVFHRMKIKEVNINGKLLNSEEGIECFISLAHQRSLNIDDLIELIELKKQ
ncbi:MAG: hypothetical protein ABSC54_10240 [Smithellaceae bacterium]|jgi:hypothetical protein